MEAYVFGDRFQVIRFKADVIYLFIETFKDNSISRKFDTPDFSNIAYVFAHLLQDDIFLDLLVELHCRRYNSKEEDEHEFDTLPHKFLVRVLRYYSKIRVEDTFIRIK